MDQSPYWEADSRSACKEILRLLCNPYSQKPPPPRLILLLGQMNPVHTFTLYLRSMMSGHFLQTLRLKLHIYTYIYHIPIRAICTTHLILFEFFILMLRIFLYTTASRPAVGPTQPPIQWVPEALFLGVKQQGLEADHSPPCAGVKNAWNYTSTPQIRLHGVVLS
jgi:hypothetical protein